MWQSTKSSQPARFDFPLKIRDGGGSLLEITSALFFKRILNFTQETTPLPDLRQAARHAVGLTFPFKAVLSLSPHDADGKLIVGQIKGQDWATA